MKDLIYDALEKEGNVIKAPKRVFEANSVIEWEKDKIVNEEKIKQTVKSLLQGEARLVWIDGDPQIQRIG